MPDPRRDELAASRYWNALTRGEKADSGELDPAAAAAIRRVENLAAAPLPAAARERARQRLLAQIDQAGQQKPQVDRKGGGQRLKSLIGPNGHAAPNPPQPLARWPSFGQTETVFTRHGGVFGRLALAALLVLTLLAGLLALRVVRPGWVVPLPEPLAETLLDATLEGPAAGWTPIGIERWIFQPGPATLRVPPLDGPQWIVADDGAFLAVLDGAEQTLAPGEAIVVETGQTLVLRNLGSRQASVLRGVVAAGFALEEFDRVAIERRQVLNNESLVAVPPGPSRVGFVRLTLPPGIAMPTVEARERDWLVAIVSGRLGLTIDGEVMPTGWRAGVEREVEAGGRIPALVPGTRVTLRNIGEEPLVLLRLTLLDPEPIVGAPASAAVWPSIEESRSDGELGIVCVTGNFA
jgi:hypothetical protein